MSNNNKTQTSINAEPKKQIVWITGWSGVGKTTIADYLSVYHGWHHLDGDEDIISYHNSKKSLIPEVKNSVDGIREAFNDFWFKGKSAPNELWHPFHQRLVEKCKLASKEHEKIVVSFSVYNRQVRDFLRKNLGPEISLVFLHLVCNVDVVVNGALVRLEEYLKMPNINKSVNEWWASSERMVGKFEGKSFYDIYGDFSYKNFRQMQFDKFLSGMQPLEKDEQGLTLDVSARDNSVFREVCETLELTYENDTVDMKKLSAVQKNRWNGD